MSDTVVDARGYSCPQPVLMTKRAIVGLSSGSVEVLVDGSASRDNVSRLAEKDGWAVHVEEQPDGTFKLVLTK